MADFNFFIDDGGAESDEELPDSLSQGTDSAIIALEVTEELVIKAENGDTQFKRIFIAIRDMLRNKIICSENEPQGVILFGTEKQKNSTNFKSVYIWQDIDTPSAKRIEELRTMSNISKEDFIDKFGFGNDYKISDVIWTASSMFSNTTKKLRYKNLIIIASDDDPHHGDKNLILRAKTKATDAMDQGIDIQVVSFNQDFVLNKFYRDIITYQNDEATNPIENIENLYDCLLRKCAKQQPIARVNFELFDGMNLPVTVYTAIRQATKGTPINIYEQTNEEVLMKTNMVETDTGAILLPSDIKLYQTWGGRNVVFETSEVQEMRKISDVSLKLLCFKDKNLALKPTYHVKPAQYLSLSDYTGDGYTMFKLIHKKCREKNLVAVCSYMPRSNSVVTPVALLPSDTNEESAVGFHIIFLPMADDIRELDVFKDDIKTTNEQVEAAENIIRKLKFTYTPENIDNPSLQRHYRYLEALALDSDSPENVVDHTLPNLERIKEKAQDQIDAFKKLVFTEQPIKRKAATNGDTNKAKVSKTVTMPDIDVEEYASHGKLHTLTVATLKTICKMKGLAIAGKKADLIQAIENSY